MRDVEIVNWNPRRYKVPLARHLAIGPRVNNFGDLIGPTIADVILDHSEIANATSHGRRMLAVGSIMHFAQSGDTVWGTGVNGKVRRDEHVFSRLDVRAVRGPRTREWLFETRGIEAPAIYGDPALLIPSLMPSVAERASQKSRRLAVIPNLNERHLYSNHPAYVNPRWKLAKVLDIIATSEVVVGSSLHAIIVADALGIPSGLVRSRSESPFKYDDYFAGTGRDEAESFADLPSALDYANSFDARSYDPLINWDSGPLLNAFPVDLWTS